MRKKFVFVLFILFVQLHAQQHDNEVKSVEALTLDTIQIKIFKRKVIKPHISLSKTKWLNNKWPDSLYVQRVFKMRFPDNKYKGYRLSSLKFFLRKKKSIKFIRLNVYVFEKKDDIISFVEKSTHVIHALKDKTFELVLENDLFLKKGKEFFIVFEVLSNEDLSGKRTFLKGLNFKLKEKCYYDNIEVQYYMVFSPIANIIKRPEFLKPKRKSMNPKVYLILEKNEN